MREDATSMSSQEHIEKFDQQISGIAKVTDGDTIKIDKNRVRLIAIDAPETSQTCFDTNYQEYNCGIISKNFLINLAENKEVICYYSKLDRYQRYLGKCFVGEMMINAEMVKNGMAVSYFFGHKDAEIMSFEEQAKQQKLGIWQGAFELPQDYRKSMRR